MICDFRLFFVIFVFVAFIGIELFAQVALMDEGKNPDPYVASGNYLKDGDLNRPVIIACHGFSASTAEWKEFKTYAEANSNVYVQLVLLGGHGRNLKAFKKATWQEWRQPIIDTITYYKAQGFKNIHVIGSSASGPLILSLASTDVLNSKSIKSVIFVDPFIIPKPKSFEWIDTPASWFVRNIPVHWGESEDRPKYFYVHYPIAALKELKKLVDRIRVKLDRKIVLPSWISVAIFQSENDPVSDSAGANLLAQQLSPFPDLYMVDSTLHVFTRSIGQEPKLWGPKDVTNQQWAFDEIIKFCKGVKNE